MSISKNKKTKIILISTIYVIIAIIISIAISKKSLGGNEEKIYKFLKDNNYGSTGGGDARYGFTVFSKSGSFVGCFNMEFKEIDCSRIPNPLDTKSIHWIDFWKINEKLGYKEK